MGEPQRLVRMIVNGRFSGNDTLREAIEELREQGHQIEVRVTYEKGDAALFAAEAVMVGYETLVSAGGDGTLNEVINGMMKAGYGAGCMLGLVPFGTGNDFANYARIPVDDPGEALRLAMKSKPTLVDVGRVNERLFINLASGGFGAEVTSQTPNEIKAVLGSAAYPLFGLASLGSILARRIRVNAPDFEWEGPAYLIAVGNGCLAGGGFHVCPRAVLDDGMLDLVIVPEVPLTQFVSLVNDVLRLGKHLETQKVVYRQVPWLEVQADEGLQVNLDGEPFYGTDFHFSIAGQIPMLLPPEAPTKSQVLNDIKQEEEP